VHIFGGLGQELLLQTAYTKERRTKRFGRSPSPKANRHDTHNNSPKEHPIMTDFHHPHLADEKNPDFPYAPENWQVSDAERVAREEGIELGPDHMSLLRALQEFFYRHDKPDIHIRQLRDALDEKFHEKGGMKHLFRLFPSGPVAQGCRLAGLPVPAGAVDKSFGSVQ
jgi:TusE/DsrC/DsvC family sulfur relay protein